MNILTAQTAFSLKEIRLPKAMEEKVKLQVSEFQAYEINLLAFNNYLKKHAPTDSIPIKINIGTRHSIDCRVAEYEVRAKNCEEVAVKAHEMELKKRGRCDTYKETVDSKVHQKFSLFASANYFSAYFYINGEAYELVSLAFWGVELSSKNVLIFHKRSDVLTQSLVCGTANISTIKDTVDESSYRPETAVRFVELAIVADYEYFSRNNPTLSRSFIDAKIRTHIMHVNVELYEIEYNLIFKIVLLEIWESQNHFPFSYPFIGTTVDRWDKIRAYFNPESASNPPFADYVGKRSCVQRDAALLFTYRQDGLAGTASGATGEIGRRALCGTDDPSTLSHPTLCRDKNGWAYAVVVQDKWETSAHELAHLFGALDNDGDCGIMCYGCTTEKYNRCERVGTIYSGNITYKFNGDNWRRVERHIYSTGIIYTFGCPEYSHTSGSCLLNEPDNNSPFIAGNDVICGWSNYSIDIGAEALWETEDPDIIRSSGGFPFTGTSIQIMSNVQGSHVLKATFQYNCRPYVQYKVLWVGPPQLPEVSYATDDVCNNTNGMCQVFSVSFNKLNTQGVYNLSIPVGSTGSFEQGSINVYVPVGGCESVSGTAYNECGTTDFSQTVCHTSLSLMAKNELTIFPNPANSSFFVGTFSKGVVSVFNVLGEKMGVFNKDDYSRVEIETTAWASGVYIVKFNSNQGTISTKKVTVSH